MYVGPDQLIPLSGALGTAAGLLLMFWGKVLQAFRKVSTLLGARASSAERRP